MSDEKNEKHENPVIKVASVAAGASVGIAFLAFLFLREISGAGMFAVALMVAAPSVMAVCICYFITKQKSN